uniref:Amyloid beta protein binding family B member 3 n=1 Tax=Callithrix jacchus TaxID=9483 RepID=A0A8I3WE96_CALJA
MRNNGWHDPYYLAPAFCSRSSDVTNDRVSNSNTAVPSPFPRCTLESTHTALRSQPFRFLFLPLTNPARKGRSYNTCISLAKLSLRHPAFGLGWRVRDWSNLRTWPEDLALVTSVLPKMAAAAASRGLGVKLALREIRIHLCQRSPGSQGVRDRWGRAREAGLIPFCAPTCFRNSDRDFAFVASDKDSCMLKCHVFRCDVPAKAIASVLHGLCAQILSERIGVSGDASCCSPDPISPEDLPRQVELLDAVSQAAQKYEALYMGTLPVTKAMGMDVLNEAIGALTARGDRNAWVPTTLSVSDSLMTAYPVQAEASTEEEPLWQCPVRLVTFIGVGRDPHTFGLIADLGRQSFQCAAFWCQPHAGGLSEAVQAACMVQYQKCLVASAARGKAWGAQARARLRLKRTSSMDSPGGPLPLPLLKGGVGSAGATPRKRGVFSFLDAFRLKPSLLHMP